MNNQYNIYENNLTNNSNNTEKKLVSEKFNQAKDGINTGIIARNFNESILNNTSRADKHLQYQDFKDHPSEKDKFMVSPLSGQKVLKEHFGHNNTTPFFGSNIKQNMSEGRSNSSLEYQTGNIENYRSKAEVLNLFEPEETVNFVDGSPVYDDELKKRFVSSYKRQKEHPIQKVNVGPGLNQGYTAEPCGGLNQSNTRDFILPRTVDELRTKTNPKLQYKGRIIAGMKEEQRGLQARISKNLPDRYYNNSSDRYFTSNVNKKARIRDKVRAKRTNRQCSISYTGTAGPTINIKPEKRGLFRKTRRNCYVNVGTRNAGSSGTWSGDKDEENYGKHSFKLPLNERDTTQKEVPLMNLTTNIKAIISPIQDVFRGTRKENFIGNVRPNGNFGAQMPKKMTVHDVNDVAKTTIKETNIHDVRTGNMYGPNKLTVYDPNDVARTTIKETNIHDVRSGNMHGPNKLMVYDPNDIAKTTIKETNIHDNRSGNINSVVSKVPVYDPNDIAKVTIKETNIHDSRTGNMGLSAKNQVYNQDKAKVTVRNTLEEVDKNINLKAVGGSRLTVHDPNDVPATTVKDTNIHDVRTGNVEIQGVDKNNAYLTTKVQMPNTNKQFTSDNDYHGIADGDVGKGGGEGYLVTKYDAKNINRQYLADNDYTGNADSSSSKPQSYDSDYNAQLNYNKEKISVGRQPTNSSTKVCVGESDINIDIKKLESDIINIREMNVEKIYSAVPGKIEPGQTTEKVPLPQDMNTQRIDPDILSAFNKNPYSQSLGSY